MAWKASGSTDLPLADQARPWDAQAAEKRVRAWAGGEDNMDWGKYAKAFFAVDTERREEFGGYKLPFADIVDGRLTAVPRGIFAVAAVLQGSRGGVDLPEDVQNAIKRKVAAYYHKMDLAAPWENRSLAVRFLGRDDGVWVGGYSIVWGGRDLYNTYFTPETDLWLGKIAEHPPVLFDHGFDPKLRHAVLGSAQEFRADDTGLWVTAKLREHEEYLAYIRPLVEAGVLGWSSGAVAHLVDVDRDGHIRSWPIAEFSLTHVPAEPRTLGVTELRGLVEEVPAIRSYLPEDADEAPETGEASVGEHVATDNNRQTEVRTMAEEKKVEQEQPQVAAPAPEVDVDAIAVKAADALYKKLAEEPPEKFGLFAVKKVTERGFSNDAVAAFRHWLRTGDEIAVRGALQEGTDSEGGYLVPEDFYAQVAKKLGENSIARAMGATVINTTRDVINVPVEATEMTNFAVTAEEGSYDENEPTFGQLQLNIYKFTKLVKVSEELLEDSAVNLDALLANMFAKALAETENYYFLVGSGSSQPQGAVAGGTLGVTAASASAITAGEVVDLYFSLPSQYRARPNVCWVMDDSTEKVIRKIQATSSAGEFLFQVTPAGTINPDQIMGRRVWNASAMPDIAASAKVILFGDWSYYYIAQRAGLVVQRNPYLYQATGQVGLFAKFRLGGGVALADAFRYLQMASA